MRCWTADGRVAPRHNEYPLSALNRKTRASDNKQRASGDVQRDASREQRTTPNERRPATSRWAVGRDGGELTSHFVLDLSGD